MGDGAPGKQRNMVRRHSRVLTDLPGEVRAEVDRLLLEPGITYEDIREFLAGKGFDISHSSIGRYGKEHLLSYQRLKIAIDQAKAMKGEVGDGLALEEAVANLALQQVMDGLVAGRINAAEVPKLLGQIGQIQSSSVRREQFKAEITEEIRRQERERAADQAAKIAKKGGLSSGTVQEIRRQILGIAE
ncbi:MAG: hypothetical protein A4E68_00028 [Syntrophaceae bacterium PtaB.Bin095]|nr:MAG: hypothetical protein A4E68_00028 [Syntrophaceae bacterium PtaB.Bin095]